MKRKPKIVILSTVILMIICGLLVSSCKKSTTGDEVGEEDKYVPVEIEEVAIGTIEDEIKINGKVIANEEIMVIPKMVGTVTEVNAELGDFVKKGSILFTIEQDDISKGIEQAANAIEIANSGVAQAENGLHTAKLNYELNKEKIENAQLNLERIEELYEEGIVSKSDLEQAQLAASEKNLDVLIAQVDQAETVYQQALHQLRQAEISHEQALDGLDNTVVKAPISGYLSELNAKEGQIIASGQPAATIVEMDKVCVQINVVENVVNKLKEGQKVKVGIPAVLDKHVTGTIDYISPTTDIRTQLYAVKTYIDNPDKKIKPGMNGEVKIVMDTVDSTIIVKEDAVLDREDKKFVFVVEDNKAVEREIVIGLDTGGDYIEVKEGLEEGEHVIIEGHHYVENGGEVKVVGGD